MLNEKEKVIVGDFIEKSIEYIVKQTNNNPLLNISVIETELLNFFKEDFILKENIDLDERGIKGIIEDIDKYEYDIEYEEFIGKITGYLNIRIFINFKENKLPCVIIGMIYNK